MKILTKMCLLLLSLPVLADSPGGDFQLRAHDGSLWSTLHARGKVVVLFFGYSSCPDVCPTALAGVAAALRELGADAEQVRPVFVSLDPDRDTPEKLKEYVQWFHPGMIGLTGTRAELERVTERYRVRYKDVGKGETENYSVDHAASLYLLDRGGALTGILPHGLPPAALVDAIRRALGDGGHPKAG